jgi:hypothetical protein
MRKGLASSMVLAGLLGASIVQRTDAAPIAAPVVSTNDSRPIEHVYYYHGRYYPYRWHGGDYAHRAYHHGHWHYY